MQLENVTAVVSGGASGLGLATVRELLEKGALVTVLDLPGAWTPELSADLAERYSGRVRFAAADVTDEEAVRRAIESARETGPLRVLVHCAGRGSDRLRIVNRENQPGELASFASVVTINLVGTYNVLRLAAAAMSANELVDGARGACVLTASVAAFDGQIGQTSYAASKAGVHGMTLVAARDLASHGIRVNTIAPGTFDTPMLARLRSDLRDKLAADVPYPKRLGNPSEFGRLAVSVLENDYLNGETIRLDGAIRMAPR